MANLVNLKTYLWALATIQPASPQEAHAFLKIVTNVTPDIYTEEDLNDAINRSMKLELIECVSKKHNIYTLTIKGGDFLGKKLRLLRDKNRLFLLKTVKDASLKIKDSPEQNKASASSATMFRSTVKVAPWPENSLVSGPLPQNQRVFWPRVSEQLRIGSNAGGSFLNLNYYSKNKLPNINENFSSVDLFSELIGISPRLLSSFIKAPSRHYRTFTLQKKSGRGHRTINSPRVFIKTVQYWICDYFLYKLNQHDLCFSFRKNRSIKDNARIHLGSRYILCLDIDSFFDNIKTEHVHSCLIENGFSEDISSFISRIATLDGCLPQGAPTSPIISNSYLYNFDKVISEFCGQNGMTYSRYADDLTIGSTDYTQLEHCITFISEQLTKFELKINKRKTRIISNNNAQIVTGVCINNEQLRPSRKFRKEVRAAFHNAKSNNDKSSLPRLYGYLNYLSSFDNGDTPHNISEFKSIIDSIKKAL